MWIWLCLPFIGGCFGGCAFGFLLGLLRLWVCDFGLVCLFGIGFWCGVWCVFCSLRLVWLYVCWRLLFVLADGFVNSVDLYISLFCFYCVLLVVVGLFGWLCNCCWLLVCWLCILVF